MTGALIIASLTAMVAILFARGDQSVNLGSSQNLF
jgi:hypothetical protein